MMIALNMNYEDHQQRLKQNANTNTTDGDLSEWDHLTEMFDNDQMLFGNFTVSSYGRSDSLLQKTFERSLPTDTSTVTTFQSDLNKREVPFNTATYGSQTYAGSQPIELRQQVKGLSESYDFSKLMMVEASSFADLLRCNQLFYQHLHQETKGAATPLSDLKHHVSQKRLALKSHTPSYRNLSLQFPDSSSMAHQANATWSIPTSTPSIDCFRGIDANNKIGYRPLCHQYSLQESMESNQRQNTSICDVNISGANQRDYMNNHSQCISTFEIQPIEIRPMTNNQDATTVFKKRIECKSMDILLPSQKKIKKSDPNTGMARVNTVPATNTFISEGAILTKIGRRLLWNDLESKNTTNQSSVPSDDDQQMKDWMNELQQSMIPPYQLHKSKVLLLKPLSPYNYFYRDERDNIVQSISSNTDPLPLPICDFTISRMQVLLYQHWYIDPMKKKRLHRKSHGKMKLEQLSCIIAERWHSLPDIGRNFYRIVARYDDIYYHEQLNVCNEMFGKL